MHNRSTENKITAILWILSPNLVYFICIVMYIIRCIVKIVLYYKLYYKYKISIKKDAQP